MQPAITLKSESDVPLHRQIYEEWRQGILRGRFRGGERLPSTRELASTLGVARSTVTAAYEQLAAEGYLDSARGSGTFVCRELPDELLHARRAAAHRTGGGAAVRPPVRPPLRLSRYGTGLAADAERRSPARHPGWLHFSQWRPDLDHFPFGLWRRLMNRHLRSPTAELFDYAESALGYAPLRREIAAYAARTRAVRCTPDQILVVNGSQQGLELCARLLLDRGDLAAVENPGYPGVRQIFRACGANLAAAPVDGDGLVPTALSDRARLVYVTPSHQFPSGVSMSVARRLELIEWARRHNAGIVEDDYDSEYRYSGPPLPAMQGLESGAPVIYIGTFSKVMFPGLRLGYTIAPPEVTAVFARAKWLMDRQTQVLEQAALADFLREGHLERHTRRMRRLYGRRREVLVEALAKHFGARAKVLGDEAGMHVLVRFEDAHIAERAAANRVQLANSDAYYLGRAPRNEFVIGFSSLSETLIREGVRRLAG